MKKSKIEISERVIVAIRDSKEISDQEKLKLFRYVAYMTYEEQQELCVMI